MSRSRILNAALFSACTALGATANAQPDKAVEPAPDQAQQAEQTVPEPVLVVREILVLETDRYGEIANNPKLVHTTLFSPIKHTGRDKKVDSSGSYEQSPMPLGIITFEGEIDEPIRLRVKVNDKSGRIHAHWPSDALVGKSSVEWRGLRNPDTAKGASEFSDPEGWLSSLRESEDRAWLQSRDPVSKERFMMYDASFEYSPALSLSLKDKAYRVKSRSPERAAPPLTLFIQKDEKKGVKSDALLAPWPQPTALIGNIPADNDASFGSIRQSLAPLAELLERRGYNPEEIELAQQMVASAGLHRSNMSLVYVLPIGEIDEHVELRMKPEPDKLIRTAIVVVTNVDPDLGSQVEGLIADLGSEQWAQRDRAQRELLALGQAAIRKIQTLKKHQDPEIAFRARQILDDYDLRMGGP